MPVEGKINVVQLQKETKLFDGWEESYGSQIPRPKANIKGKKAVDLTELKKAALQEEQVLDNDTLQEKKPMGDKREDNYKFVAKISQQAPFLVARAVIYVIERR